MPLILAAAALVGSSLAPQAPSIPVAPRSLAATAGRGEAVLFDTDAKGERILDAAKPGREQVVYKETIRPLHWAVVIGTVDFRAVRLSVAGLPKPDAGPFWPCRRIDLERQARMADGGWSDWTSIDADANLRVLDRLTEVASERVRPEARPEAFVDPLPSLKAGDRRGVDVEALVDERLRDIPRRAVRPGTKPPAVAADQVMIRAFDFTAEPGATYRYRARVVVLDPAPVRHPEIFGPWSEPTGEVTVPKE
jgi:hypothetical protein